jgi:chemotaxis protein histidine kinase CheA
MSKTSIIRPRRHISQKVPKSGGPTPDKAILRALNAAEDLMGSYQGWAVDDLADLWHKFQAIEHREVRQSEISEMFDITHEIRGQGGTFGFDLISHISDSLCKFMDGRKTLESVEFDVIKVHILAMKAVFKQNLKGRQPELAGQLSELLLALRNKVALRRSHRK